MKILCLLKWAFTDLNYHNPATISPYGVNLPVKKYLK